MESVVFHIGYPGPAAISLTSFLTHTTLMLEGSAQHGGPPVVGLRDQVKEAAKLLRRSDEWVTKQMDTPEGYKKLVENGFSEILLLQSFNKALLSFYERVLYLSDPEVGEPTNIDTVWKAVVDNFSLSAHQFVINASGEISKLENAAMGDVACLICHGKLQHYTVQVKAAPNRWETSPSVAFFCDECGAFHRKNERLNELQVIPEEQVRPLAQ